MAKKVLVTLTDEQYYMLKEREDLGNSDSERLRNALLLYVSMKDLLAIMKKEIL